MSQERKILGSSLSERIAKRDRGLRRTSGRGSFFARMGLSDPYGADQLGGQATFLSGQGYYDALREAREPRARLISRLWSERTPAGIRARMGSGVEARFDTRGSSRMLGTESNLTYVDGSPLPVEEDVAAAPSFAGRTVAAPKASRPSPVRSLHRAVGQAGPAADDVLGALSELRNELRGPQRAAVARLMERVARVSPARQAQEVERAVRTLRHDQRLQDALQSDVLPEVSSPLRVAERRMSGDHGPRQRGLRPVLSASPAVAPVMENKTKAERPVRALRASMAPRGASQRAVEGVQIPRQLLDVRSQAQGERAGPRAVSAEAQPSAHTASRRRSVSAPQTARVAALLNTSSRPSDVQYGLRAVSGSVDATPMERMIARQSAADAAPSLAASGGTPWLSGGQSASERRALRMASVSPGVRDISQGQLQSVFSYAAPMQDADVESLLGVDAAPRAQARSLSAAPVRAKPAASMHAARRAARVSRVSSDGRALLQGAPIRRDAVASGMNAGASAVSASMSRVAGLAGSRQMADGAPAQVAPMRGAAVRDLVSISGLSGQGSAHVVSSPLSVSRVSESRRRDVKGSSISARLAGRGDTQPGARNNRTSGLVERDARAANALGRSSMALTSTGRVLPMEMVLPQVPSEALAAADELPTMPLRGAVRAVSRASAIEGGVSPVLPAALVSDRARLARGSSRGAARSSGERRLRGVADAVGQADPSGVEAGQRGFATGPVSGREDVSSPRLFGRQDVAAPREGVRATRGAAEIAQGFSFASTASPEAAAVTEAVTQRRPARVLRNSVAARARGAAPTQGDVVGRPAGRRALPAVVPAARASDTREAGPVRVAERRAAYAQQASSSDAHAARGQVLAGSPVQHLLAKSATGFAGGSHAVDADLPEAIGTHLDTVVERQARLSADSGVERAARRGRALVEVTDAGRVQPAGVLAHARAGAAGVDAPRGLASMSARSAAVDSGLPEMVLASAGVPESLESAVASPRGRAGTRASGRTGSPAGRRPGQRPRVEIRAAADVAAALSRGRASGGAQVDFGGTRRDVAGARSLASLVSQVRAALEPSALARAAGRQASATERSLLPVLDTASLTFATPAERLEVQAAEQAAAGGLRAAPSSRVTERAATAARGVAGRSVSSAPAFAYADAAATSLTTGAGEVPEAAAQSPLRLRATRGLPQARRAEGTRPAAIAALPEVFAAMQPVRNDVGADAWASARSAPTASEGFSRGVRTPGGRAATRATAPLSAWSADRPAVSRGRDGRYRRDASASRSSRSASLGSTFGLLQDPMLDTVGQLFDPSFDARATSPVVAGAPAELLGAPAWAQRAADGTHVRPAWLGVFQSPLPQATVERHGAVGALARAENAQDVVRILMATQGALGGEPGQVSEAAARLVSRIVQEGKSQAEQLLDGELSGGASATSRNAAVRQNVLHTVRMLQAPSGLKQTQATPARSAQGSGQAMKLAEKLMNLIHLAENQQKKTAQDQVRMAADTSAAKAEAGHSDGPKSSDGESSVNIMTLQQNVLESVLRELELLGQRREGFDGTKWW